MVGSVARVDSSSDIGTGGGQNIDVGSVIASYSNAVGDVDTPSMARDVAQLGQRDFAQADNAFQAISNHLTQTQQYALAGQFERDVKEEFSSFSAGGFWAPNHRADGAAILRNNPILEVRWENTVSALSGKSGFSAPLEQALREAGITVVSPVNSAPAGSLGANDPGSTGMKNNVNGALASDAIADRYQNNGFTSNREVNYDTATGRSTTATRAADAIGDVRRVDVETIVPGKRPEMDVRILTESKVGYTTNGGHVATELANDAQLLNNNSVVRKTGQALEGFGRIARPVGIALDVYSLGEAYQSDNNTIGHNTQRTASGIAGSALGGAGGAWAGAATGAALGSIVPGVGTVIGGAVGGIIGGIAGGFGGDAAGKGLFDWFN